VRTIPKRSKYRRLFSAKSAMAIAGLSLALSTAAAPMPPLVKPATQERHVGKVVFVELVTPDIVAAERFYGQMFGWKFLDEQHGKHVFSHAFVNNRPIAALVQKPLPVNEDRQSAWLSFMSVADVDAAEKEAVAHGGKVLHEAHTLPDRGREAVLADPQGAAFAVLASSSGDPEDAIAEPGEWIWSSLATSDPENGAAFYQSLFDYEVFEQPAGEHSQHLLLATGDFARASVNSLPVKGSTHPHWLNFVRVKDTVSAAQKAVNLGGRILVEPRIDRHGGKIAVIADPAGAPFGLMEWTESDSKEVAK
jgi:predicted enzyme related to lactoylglutathione lyase